MSDIPLLKELLEESKQQMFHDFAFARDNLIHTLQRKNYLRIQRANFIAWLDPLETISSSASIPTGRVWVPYHWQIDNSLPFELWGQAYFDEVRWLNYYYIPSTYKDAFIGWDPIFSSIRVYLQSLSLLDRAYFSLMGKFLEFTTVRWNEFKENFLHPLEYYATIIMEQKL